MCRCAKIETMKTIINQKLSYSTLEEVEKKRFFSSDKIGGLG